MRSQKTEVSFFTGAGGFHGSAAECTDFVILRFPITGVHACVPAGFPPQARFPLAMMRALLEQAACIQQSIVEGNIYASIGSTAMACTHDAGAPETPMLRDARSHVLATTIACLMTKAETDKLAAQGLTLLHGLLERRLMNWLAQGAADVEGLFGDPQVYDDGTDATMQLTIEEFLLTSPCSEAHDAWLRRKCARVQTEKQSRISDVLHCEALQLGMYVKVTGLKQETHLNGKCGVITTKRGERMGVIFEDEAFGTKAVKKQNLANASLVCVPAPCQPCKEEETPKTGGNLLDHMWGLVSYARKHEYDRRADVLARVKLLAEHIAQGTPPTARCGDMMVHWKKMDKHLRLIKKLQPPCVATGNVDFHLLISGAKVPSPAMREWLTSGLCWYCQRAIFG